MSASLTKTKTLIEVRDLEVHFALHGTFRSRLTGRGGGSVKAVDGVSFDLQQGEVLGLVGESGSGKTTLGRALLGLVRPTGGSVKLQGEELVGLPERQLRPLRRRLQMVFQDPHASLNPAMTLETALAHPLQIHKLTKGNAETEAKVRETLELVGLAPVERFATSLPADLSGGQKQRAAIARAIIVGPDLLVADEPVSMLDMSVRAKILDLMIELKGRLGLTYVYVTHDLASAKFFCDRVAIMYLGRIVEIGSTEEIFENPKHPYTQALIKAIPEPNPDKALPRDLPRGEIPDAASPPLGCSFIRAARRPSGRAAGRGATCARSSTSAGWPRTPRPTTPSDRSSATSTSSSSATSPSSPPARARTRASCWGCSSASATPSPTSRCGRA